MTNNVNLSAIDLLLTRQSNPFLIEPLPKQAHLDIILQAAMCVPDHAALSPWHFTLVKEQGLTKLSNIFVEAITQKNGDESQKEKASKMPFRAPLIIVISTNYVDHKVPKQEQLIAAGCAAHAMQMAAFALGYGAMWRTGDLSFDDHVKKALNITLDNDIVGFLYVGTLSKELPAKPRKSFENHISYL